MDKVKLTWKRLLPAFGLMVLVSCAIRPMPRYEMAPTLPQVDGTLRMDGLNGEVRVCRDKYGVPHIFTEDEHDLFFANGYVQAQDRLWEMYLFRAVATGRLCEIFGNVGLPGRTVMGMELSTYGMDKMQRVLGMNWLGKGGAMLLAERQPEILGQMRAFCEGINAFIDQNRNRLPIEFQVLYLEPDHFVPEDIVSLSRFYGFMLTANMEDELFRYAVARNYGEDMAWKLLPLHKSVGPTVLPPEMLKNRLSEPKALPPGGRPDPSISGDPMKELGDLTAEAAAMVAMTDEAFRGAAMFPNREASNNWVVGPSMTETGTAMLANDPHLVHIEPSLCYVMHLKGAGIDAYGVAFPGQPYIVMGHTRKLSWGATVTMGDTEDIYVETVDPKRPGQYLYKGEWRDFTVREETIRIRPGVVQYGPDHRYKTMKIKVRHSVHGPIINDVMPDLPKDTPPMALRWVGWDFSRDPDMFEKLISCATPEEYQAELDKMDPSIPIMNEGMMYNYWMKGQGMGDFIEGMKHNVILNMNWVAADADGHIAWLPGGLMPIRKKGIGALPSPGASGDYDWAGFVPLEEVPQAMDPARGYMATANNEVVDAEWYPYFFASNYAPGWRSWRIEELLNELKPISIDDMRRIQNDVYSKEAEVLVPLFLAAVEKKVPANDRVRMAAKILGEWNYEATIDSAAAAIFYDAIHYMADKTLRDEFKRKDYNEFIKGRANHAVEMWVIEGESEFFDDKRTPNKVEDRDDLLVACLEEAVNWLTKVQGWDMETWQWGKLHTIKWYHPMGFKALKEMSVGPFPHPGANNTVRNASSFGGVGKGRYHCMGGPVMRHIIDMSAPDDALLVIDGSESGQWLSPHYRDMHTLWYNGQYMRAEKRPEKIEEEAESLLLLKPM